MRNASVRSPGSRERQPDPAGRRRVGPCASAIRRRSPIRRANTDLALVAFTSMAMCSMLQPPRGPVSVTARDAGDFILSEQVNLDENRPGLSTTHPCPAHRRRKQERGDRSMELHRPSYFRATTRQTRRRQVLRRPATPLRCASPWDYHFPTAFGVWIERVLRNDLLHLTICT